MQEATGFDERRVVNAAAHALPLRQATGHFPAERADAVAPLRVVCAIGNTHAAAEPEGVGGHGFGNEIIVFRAAQLFHAVGLLELTHHEVAGTTLPFEVHVQPLVGLGVVTHDPVEQGALAAEHQLRSAQFEFAVLAVDAAGSIQIDHIVVEPIAISLDKTGKTDFIAADDVDGDICLRL